MVKMEEEIKQIEVYMQSPWMFPDSPYYKSLINNSPRNIKFLASKKQDGVIIDKKLFWFSKFLKKNTLKVINKFDLTIPNIHFTESQQNYDLIHCAHCLSKNNYPWVADIECLWQMYIGKETKRSKEKVKKILMNKNCKKIMAWTKYTKEQILKSFPEIKEKVEVIYPAIPIPHKSVHEENDNITIIYATRYFWLKGGMIALEVYKELQKKYGNRINLIFISDVPNEVKLMYPTIKIQNLVKNEELFKLYEKADIFFYPSFVDTFGFGLLEAMSFGIPIVTVNTEHTITRNEIIENNKQGFVLNIEDRLTKKLLNLKAKLVIGTEEKELINQLIEKCSILVENKKLRNEMSENCMDLIINGKFSIKERNEKLKRIYEEAII